MASLGRLFRMPQISFASTSPLLSDRTRYGYFRRTVPADTLQVLAMVDILRRFGWNYVSIFHSVDTYGSAGISAFVNVSATKDICVDLRRGIPLSFSDSDYDNLVADLKKSRANVVIFFSGPDSVIEVFKRVSKDAILRRRFVWIASDAWANEIHRAALHSYDAAAGVIGVTPYTKHLKSFDEYVSKLTIDSNKRNRWFPEFFATFTNCTPGKDCEGNASVTSFPTYQRQQDAFVPFVVEAVYAFAHALHEFLVDNCNETENAPFLWFRENRTCLGQSRELNGSSLLEYLSKVNFTSITENVIAFDESGSVQGSYKILNYQATISDGGEETKYHYESVGTWDNGQLTLREDVELQFGLNSDGSIRYEPIESSCAKCGPGTYTRDIPGSCCSICEPCFGSNYSSEPLARECSNCLVEGEREMWGNNPFTGSNSCVLIPETSATYSDPWAIPSLILGCIGLLCVAATAVVFAIYWKTPIVKSSGRELMILLLIGISCGFVLPFLYVAPPSTPICLVNELGIWFCYSLVFGSLAVRAQRIARIFYGVKQNINRAQHFTSPLYQVVFTLIIVVIQMILVAVSLVLVHPDVVRTLDDRENYSLPEVVIQCRHGETIIFALSLLYETCVITAATALGVYGFKFRENFSEAKYISFCTFSLLVLWLGLIPAYFTTQSRPDIQNAVVSLFVVLSAFAVLFFIFGPKLFVMLFQPNKNQQITESRFATDEGAKKKEESHKTKSEIE